MCCIRLLAFRQYEKLGNVFSSGSITVIAIPGCLTLLGTVEILEIYWKFFPSWKS